MLVGLAIAGWVVCVEYEAFELLVEYLEEAEEYELDEVLLMFMLLGLAGFVFAIRRWRELQKEMIARRKAERSVVWAAQHDTLTQLPNRHFLNKFADSTSAHDGKAQKPLTVLAVDLDGFKKVNDLVGHEGGDMLLKEIARRLDDVTPEQIVFRLGGDEFLVVCEGVNSESAEELANDIVMRISEPCPVFGIQVEVGACVGIAVVPGHADNLKSGIRCADAALYHAKRRGRGTIAVFSEEMGAILAERARLENMLQHAVKHNLIEMHFQPLVDLKTQKTVGFESLARWILADGSTISPDVFIPVAEESGLIIELSDQLFRKACEAAATWPSDIMLSFNISPSQLTDRRLGLRLIKILQETGLPPSRLELEITESGIIADLETATGTLTDLSNAGIKISIDDFGTGYSSLAHLSRIDFDKIKIDQSFVGSFATDPRQRKIVTAVIAMSRGLGIATTAEGIEEMSQLEEFRAIGCDGGQGFLFGRAMPAKEVHGFLGGKTAAENIATEA